MSTTLESFRAAVGSIILFSAVSGIAIMSDTFTESAVAASKNFAAKCERLTGSVKALAIVPTYSHQQICACAQTNRELRKQLGAAGIKCSESKITNFNQPAGVNGDNGDNGDNGVNNGDDGLGNPGNDPDGPDTFGPGTHVGQAGEDPNNSGRFGTGDRGQSQ
jgi:hypothetical protein